ncbi:MAG: CysS/YqeB C-terminal domain-containing protein [Acidimicrobiales bacterium]
MTRLLTIMGSGETAPTMVKTHRLVAERLGASSGVMLDTPYGFQTNAPEIAARAVEYFRNSVGVTLEIAGIRSAEALAGPGGDAVVATIAAAPFVFAGPGSPTYALRQWAGTLVPGLLAEKLHHGGAVTFASAAALTLGAATVPVYEIYKVGEEPRWVEGLDLLGPFGLPVAVIPHYDNAEGGTHDTRFCYLGEERLSLLERSLPEGAFVLGVDEHTALFADLDAGVFSVTGRGAVTVRAAGRSQRIETGEEHPLTHLVAVAADLASGAGSAPARALPEVAAAAVSSPPPVTGSPLLEAIRRFEAEFRAARAVPDPKAMAAAALGLEEEMWAWRADTLQSDEVDRGRAALRAMVGELGALAVEGARDPAELYGPFVDLALSLREAARQERRFADADAVRDRLTALGIEVRDTAEGATWVAATRDDGAPTPGGGPEGS